jgi:hypothetical protein
MSPATHAQMTVAGGAVRTLEELHRILGGERGLISCTSRLLGLRSWIAGAGAAADSRTGPLARGWEDLSHA